MSANDEFLMTKSERIPNSEFRKHFCKNTGGSNVRTFRFLASLVISHSSFRRRAGFLAMLLFVAAAAGCRREMYDQPSSKPLESSTFFRDNRMASRPLPLHTVARGQLNDDEAYYRGKIGTNLVTVFPMPVTRELLERGRERFNIYCAVCHDRTGDGNGVIVQRGFPRPPSYHIDRLRNAPIGHFYDVVTQGYGIMYSYADRVEPKDRWAIAAYIRVLQASRNINVAELTAEERSNLEKPK